MNEKTKQSTIKRLGEQIVGVLKWVRDQWQTNPLVLIVVIALVAVTVWAGYLRFVKGAGWADWTEFGEYTDPTGVYHREKTLWDLLELLIIPIVLAIGAWWLNKSERENEREIAEKNRKEDRDIARRNREKDRRIADERRNQATLEAYLDRMTELLEKGLWESKEGDEVRTIARTRTLAVLRSLDGQRKGQVVQFLQEAGLIGPKSVVVWLDGADLRGANLIEAKLIDTHLGGVNLRKANLQGALLCKSWLVEADLHQASLKETDLRSCNFSGANLANADLREALLEGSSREEKTNLLDANLDGANFKGASVSSEQLQCARSLRGTIMPNGTRHD